MNSFEQGLTKASSNDWEIESADRLRQLNEIKERLTSGGSINWESMYKSLQDISLTDLEKRDLLYSLMHYIQNQFKLGAFQNLAKISDVIACLGAESIRLTDEYINSILLLYGKYSEAFVRNLEPEMLFHNDGITTLADGRRYDRNEYVKDQLRNNGAKPEELTDEYVQKLLDLREVLIQLYKRDFHPNMLQEQSLGGIAALLA